MKVFDERFPRVTSVSKFEYLDQDNLDFYRSLVQKGWRAALKWALSKYKDYDLLDWDAVACKLKDDIDKELTDD